MIHGLGLLQKLGVIENLGIRADAGYTVAHFVVKWGFTWLVSRLIKKTDMAMAYHFQTRKLDGSIV